jgi:hypothetical protein
LADSAKALAAIALVVAVVGLSTTLYGLSSLVSPAGPHAPAGPPGPAGVNGTNGTNGKNGTNGANGSQGPSGSNGSRGPPGNNGSNGSSATYAAFAPSFVLVGMTSTVTMTYTPCVTVGSGAYECDVTLNESASWDIEFQGLNYTATKAFYASGSNPSTDWLLDENTSTVFQLWFQVTADSGTLQPNIDLHMGELSRS